MDIGMGGVGRVRRKIALASATLLVAIGLVGGAAGAVASEARSNAPSLVGSDFIPGNIISDSLFYDSAALTSAQIQAFLNSKVGTCANGKCLNVLRVSYPAKPASYSDTTGALKCTAMAAASNITAAEMIFRTQVACGISAKVILVTLQKEQGLVTKTAPSDTALKHAMGMACPDTAPCQSYAEGFANQIYLGTRQLITYKVSRFATQPGVRTILYNPNAGCGSSTFNIQNYATAALYAYTPYRPNAAALANLGGTGDGCSSYGNRNFWVYYNNWFGTTHPASSPTVTADTVLGEPSNYLFAAGFDGALWTYPLQSDGSWAPRSQAGSGWTSTSAIFGAGDFNGDGHDDLLARDIAGSLWLYPRDGLGGWGSATRLSTGWGSFDNVFGVGDFTGDGKPDLISRYLDGGLYLYPGNGAGGWGAASKIGGGWGPYQVAPGGDLTGDDVADILALDTAGRLWVYPGTGTSTIAPRTQVPGNFSGYTSVFGGVDFNADGNVDIVGRDGTGGLWVFYGNAAGGWTTSARLGGGWDQFATITPPHVKDTTGLPDPTTDPVSTGAGDLNGDAKADLVGLDTRGQLWLYPVTGAGTVGARAQLTGTWKGYTTLFGVGDFNGDGLPDVIARDVAGTLWYIPVKAGGGWGTRVKIGGGWGGFTALFPAGDFNRDGHPDVWARNAAGGLLLYAGSGTGTFRSAVQLGSGFGPYKVSASGDFSGDGQLDILATDSAGALWIYRGNPTGNGWQARVQIPGAFGGFTSISGGADLTGDGKADFLARESGGTVWLYPGSGPSTVGPRISLGTSWASITNLTPAGVHVAVPPSPGGGGTPTPGTIFAGPGVGDITGDGKVDVVAVDATGPVYVYPGDGATGWSLPRVQLAPDWRGYTATFGAGDFDGDGHPDTMARDASGALWLIPTDGAGALLPRIKVSVGWNVFDLVTGGGDLTGDGFPDVLARDTSGGMTVFPGNGRGGWLGSFRVGGGWTPYTVFPAGDFDGDGRGDVLARDSAGVLWLYRGSGTGWLGRVQVSSGWSDATALFASKDFTGDGKLDILARSSAGALSVYAGDGAGGVGAPVVIGSGWNAFSALF